MSPMSGQVVNTGVLASTVRHYLGILEATYMLRRLPPLQANLGKPYQEEELLQLIDNIINAPS